VRQLAHGVRVLQHRVVHQNFCADVNGHQHGVEHRQWYLDRSSKHEGRRRRGRGHIDGAHESQCHVVEVRGAGGDDAADVPQRPLEVGQPRRGQHDLLNRAQGQIEDVVQQTGQRRGFNELEDELDGRGQVVAGALQNALLKEHEVLDLGDGAVDGPVLKNVAAPGGEGLEERRENGQKLSHALEDGGLLALGQDLQGPPGQLTPEHDCQIVRGHDDLPEQVGDFEERDEKAMQRKHGHAPEIIQTLKHERIVVVDQQGQACEDGEANDPADVTADDVEDIERRRRHEREHRRAELNDAGVKRVQTQKHDALALVRPRQQVRDEDAEEDARHEEQEILHHRKTFCNRCTISYK